MSDATAHELLRALTGRAEKLGELVSPKRLELCEELGYLII